VIRESVAMGSEDMAAKRVRRIARFRALLAEREKKFFTANEAKAGASAAAR
jgi:hypothetical protein